MTDTSISSIAVPTIRSLVEHPKFRITVVLLILLNAALLGLETSRSLSTGIYAAVVMCNHVILGCFVIELILRLVAYRLSFFRDPWNIFDFVIILASMIVPAGPFQVVRSLRILRVVRLVSAVPSLKRVVEGLLGALPGIGSVLFLLLLVLYVAGVMATVLFRDILPEDFGHLGLSLFSLFQIMTLEGWAEIADGAMEVYSWAWIFFVGYILVATFLVLNLVIGVVIGSIQSRIQVEIAEENEGDAAVRSELIALRNEIAALRELVESQQSK